MTMRKDLCVKYTIAVMLIVFGLLAVMLAGCSVETTEEYGRIIKLGAAGAVSMLLGKKLWDF